MPAPELEGATMPQKLAFATDNESNINYLMLTSDMPIGYYVQDREASFNGIFERLSAQGTNFTIGETIYSDSIEGRYFTGVLKGDSFVRSWYFIRGNRSIYFLQQNLSKEPITDDYFIKTLKFLPIKPAKLVADTLANYAFKRFGKFKVIEDDESVNFIEKTTSIMVQNPYSAGTYLAEFNQLTPYFNVLNLDSFYTNYSQALVGWSDSLISETTITVDGKPGREIWVYSGLNKSKSRHRFWIDNTDFVTVYAFCADEEYGTAPQEAFFSSFKRLPNSPVFDIYASKAEKLLNNLSNEDTSLQKAAFRALDYYEFDSTEAPLLHIAVQKPWPDDTIVQGIRGQLIDYIEILGRNESIPVLAALYQDQTVPNDLRNQALLAIQELGDSGITTFCNLFIANPPDSVAYYHAYFSPFFDSLSFAATQFERLLPLMDDKILDAGVLDLADRLMTKDSATYYPLVYAALPTLTANAIAEANMEVDSINAEYYYSASLTQLFVVLGHFAGYPVIDPFTTILMNDSLSEYIVADAIKLRLKSKLAVPQKALARCFSDNYSRFHTVGACYQTGNEKLIPKFYKTAEGIAQTMFMEYFNYSDEYPDKVKTIGTIEVDGETYYALQAEFEWDENFNYFGVCGPINKKNPLAALKTAKCNSDWESTQTDWKAQAKLITATLQEEGWPWED